MTKKDKKLENTKTCTRCNRTIKLHNFYSTDSEMFSDGYITVCKQCLKEMVDEDDLETVYRTLRAIDKPFLKDVWKKAKSSKNNTFGDYMRMVSSLHQYRNLTYSDSILEEEIEEEEEVEQTPNYDSSIDNIEEIETEIGVIKVTKELKAKWGNYSNREILEMEKNYQEMLMANDISTPQHRSQLQIYCKLLMFMNKALQEKDYSAFEKLSRQFDALIKSSGFRPIDRKSSDEATGMRNFSTIFQEVERNGFVEPLDIDKVENQDIVDKTIMYFSNYVRKLVGKEALIKPPSDTPKVESSVSHDK
jgi:hypothetical protein